ncbi:MAG: HEAT repeat domain-containing protein, partial [Nostocaceae cyanobacterium]|nr:HEAT repeat domain-containing protein [Nostocaceae cyanobacterium]
KIGTERVFHPITLALKDPFPCVRIAAVSSLSRIGGEWAIDTLLTALRDPYWQGRKSNKYVYNALIKIGGVRVEEELLNALYNPSTNRFVRRTIISLFAKIGTKKSNDILISLIENSSGWLKVMAINKSYQIVEQANNHDYISRIIDHLIIALGDAQSQVRISVISQMRFIVVRPQYVDYLEPLISPLVIAAGDKNKHVSRAAITTLSDIYGASFFDVYIETLTNSVPSVAKQGIEITGKILYFQIIRKLPIVNLTNDQINLAITRLKIASTNSELLVSQTAKEILTQLQI